MKDSSLKKMLDESLNFSINYFNDILARELNYSQLLQELDKQYKYWSKIDKNINVDTGFNMIFLKIINCLKESFEKIKNEQIENKNEIFYKFRNELYQLNNDEELKKFIVLTDYSYNFEITINIKFLSKDDSNIKAFVKGYKYCKKNEKEEVLDKFIELFNKSNRGEIYNYLNSDIYSYEHNACMLYIAVITKNYNELKEPTVVDEQVISLKSELESIDNALQESKNYLQEFNDDYKEELQKWKKEQDIQIENYKNEAKKINDDYVTRFDKLEKLYAEKLKLKKPSDYWQECSSKQNKLFKRYAIVSVILFGLLVGGVAYILYDFSYLNDIVKNNKSFFPVSFIVIGLISLLIYSLRVCIKLMMSSKHLATEYEQKSMFTYFYLTLLNDDKIKSDITETERNLIYSNLFSNPDTGLVKSNNDNSDIVNLLTSLIKK